MLAAHVPSAGTKVPSWPSHQEFPHIAILRSVGCDYGLAALPDDADFLLGFYRDRYRAERPDLQIDRSYVRQSLDQARLQAKYLDREARSRDGTEVRTAVDVGCGLGYLLLELQRRGLQSYGVEADPGVARYASDRLGLSVEYGTLERLAEESPRFDLVVLSHVFEHLP